MDLDYGSVTDWDTLGRSLTLLALEAVFYFVLTLWLDRQNRHGTSLCSALRSCHSRCALPWAVGFQYKHTSVKA